MNINIIPSFMNEYRFDAEKVNNAYNMLCSVLDYESDMPTKTFIALVTDTLSDNTLQWLSGNYYRINKEIKHNIDEKTAAALYTCSWLYNIMSKIYNDDRAANRITDKMKRIIFTMNYETSELEDVYSCIRNTMDIIVNKIFMEVISSLKILYHNTKANRIFIRYPAPNSISSFCELDEYLTDLNRVFNNMIAIYDKEKGG